jgi:hypothetical protein
MYVGTFLYPQAVPFASLSAWAVRAVMWVGTDTTVRHQPFASMVRR